MHSSPSITSAVAPALVRASGISGLPSMEEALVVVLDVDDAGPAPYLTALRARAEAESVALGYAAS